MKTCFYQYRKGLFERLSLITYGGSAVPVYQYTPAGVGTPYIYIGDMNATPENDADRYSQTVTTEIHVVTSYQGDQASMNTADAIMDLVMQWIISKGVTVFDRDAAILMDDFEMTPNQMVSLSHVTEFDDINKQIRSVLTVSAIIDQKPDVS